MAKEEAILEVKIQGTLKELAEDIRGCRKKPEFPSSKDEIFRKKDKRTFNKSIGKGHLAAMEFITFYCKSYIPRLWTLMLACSPYISKLQESTRSVEHHDYYIPDYIKQFPDVVDIIEQEFQKSFDLYKKALDKGMEKQNAMYCLPLYTLTGDSFKLNLRGLYQLKLIYPNIITEIYDWCMKKLELNTRLGSGFEFNFKEWLEEQKPVNDISNYDYCPIFVYDDDDPKNYEKYFNILISQNDTKLINCSVPFNKNSLKFLIDRNRDPLYTGIRKSRTDIRLDFRCDLSVLHELLRHRTLKRNLLPLTFYDEFDYYKHRAWKDAGLYEEYDENNKNLESLYNKLVESVPKSVAAGVLPHSLMINGNIGCDFKSMFDFLGQRVCKRAKPAIQKLANSLKDQIQKKYKLNDDIFYNCEKCVDSCDFK